ncbi:MAG: ATP-binding protein, partial [Cupriavidus sp.]|nr:ATP-binding protein [Cupriavidus sp.]
QRAEFSLHLLVHEVCEMHRESSPDAVIVEHWDDGVPEVFHGDARLLFQALNNLVGNAVKYSPPGAPVCVDVTMESGVIAVCVADQGIGIPEKDLNHVFERYVRGANVTGTAGAGVGLYIVRLAAELHGGTVSVMSAEGTGSRFVLSLPGEPVGLSA